MVLALLSCNLFTALMRFRDCTCEVTSSVYFKPYSACLHQGNMEILQDGCSACIAVFLMTCCYLTPVLNAISKVVPALQSADGSGPKSSISRAGENGCNGAQLYLGGAPDGSNASAARQAAGEALAAAALRLNAGEVCTGGLSGVLTVCITTHWSQCLQS